MSMFLDVVAALFALGTAAVWILTARGELPPDWDHLRTMSRGHRSPELAMRSRPQRWNQRRARAFGLGGGIMAPIERFFIATAVSGFVGLIASIVWLIIR